jgi:hypothetical protein
VKRSIARCAAAADELFLARRSSLWGARQQAIQWIGQQVQAQASYLRYMEVFWVLMLISLAAVPRALTLRKSKLGVPPMPCVEASIAVLRCPMIGPLAIRPPANRHPGLISVQPLATRHDRRIDDARSGS